MENYHKHTCGSNIFTPDSAATYEQYARRAVELGQHTLSSVEHGWQGKYHEVRETAIKYGLKFIFGAEAYWVLNRTEKDSTNCHIILLAKNENGREAINEVLSEANETGYYYKPRIDIELLMSLPENDVVITSACVAFWHYDNVEEVIKTLHDKFKDNFYLEVQYHNIKIQKEINEKVVSLSEKYGIRIIAGLDSHYVFPEQAVERDELLAARDMHYDDEDGMYLDYPDEETVRLRFSQQGVLSQDQIDEAIKNTDVVLSFDDYKSQVFEKNRKLPTLYKDKTQEEKNKIYSRLITKLFKEYMENVPESEYQKYFDGVKMEVDTYKETGMTDYPLIDYEIVRLAKQRGGMITKTGRGSAVGYFTNTLCGFSCVDRFQSPIKLYPERFISKTRIIESNSLPDIDLNVGNQEIFEQAQRDILGKDHAYPMIAFGTLKKKAAFKMYARAQNLDFGIANEISKQISNYDEALKFADEDERDEMSVYDFVDKTYHDYVKKSEVYWGIIASKSKAPCAYLLYQGSIRKEIGLIKCKSESTGKEYITTVIDGAVAENYKFLKNDLLSVDVVYLIDTIFEKIHMKPLTVKELSEAVNGNERVWDIYAKGLTIGINQCEKQATTARLMRYKPQNVSELAAFIAAIRPGFKSMYSRFESREDFSYGIKALDEAIQTKEFPYSYMLYQENLMAVLNLAGFPMDQCYGIIKAIAKKHPEKVRPLKAQFIEGFKNIIKDDCPADKTPDELADEVWKIIDDSTRYSFNSAHAYSMALDSLYNAYQKAYYPYEFYEVLMQRFSAKGKKEKVAELKREMKRGFGINEGPIKWGADNRKFWSDKENHCIYPSLLSIKGLSQGCANDLYALSKNKYASFYDLWKDLKKTRSLNSKKIETLIKLEYFDCFGGDRKILKFIDAANILYERTSFSKEEPCEYLEYIKKYSETTDKLKTYKNLDYDAALRDIWEELPNEFGTPSDIIKAEIESLGYIRYTMPELPQYYYYVEDVTGKFKNKNIRLYQMATGSEYQIKVKGALLDQDPINPGDIINVKEERYEFKWFRDKDGEWKQSDSERELILKKYVHVR